MHKAPTLSSRRAALLGSVFAISTALSVPLARAEQVALAVAPKSTSDRPHSTAVTVQKAVTPAFGFLEFDWDLTEGIPGFDNWPARTVVARTTD